MDITNLRKIVATHTPLNFSSSLPFAVELNGGLQIRWFIYDVVTNDRTKIIVTRICTLDRNGRVDVKMAGNYEFDAYSDLTQKVIDDYYKKFINEFNSNDKEKLDKMLMDIQTEDMLMLYGAISIVEALQ